MKLGEGIEYIRRPDGFTLRVDCDDFAQADGWYDIHMSDELFESLVVIQQRHTGFDPSLSASGLNEYEVQDIDGQGGVSPRHGMDGRQYRR